jgi:hypothetical protein
MRKGGEKIWAIVRIGISCIYHGLSFADGGDPRDERLVDDERDERRSGYRKQERDLDAKQSILRHIRDRDSAKRVVRLRRIRAPGRPSSPIERFDGRRSHLRVIDVPARGHSSGATIAKVHTNKQTLGRCHHYRMHLTFFNFFFYPAQALPTQCRAIPYSILLIGLMAVLFSVFIYF